MWNKCKFITKSYPVAKECIHPHKEELGSRRPSWHQWFQGNLTPTGWFVKPPLKTMPWAYLLSLSSPTTALVLLPFNHSLLRLSPCCPVTRASLHNKRNSSVCEILTGEWIKQTRRSGHAVWKPWMFQMLLASQYHPCSFFFFFFL